jgi:hypothetical protein
MKYYKEYLKDIKPEDQDDTIYAVDDEWGLL